MSRAAPPNFRAVPLGVLCLAAGCGGAAAPGAGSAAAGGAADTLAARTGVSGAALPDDFTCEHLAWTLVAADPTREGLAARFGEPEGLDIETEPNRHVEGQIDTLYTVRYDGLTSYIRTPSGGRDLPDHVVITDNRFIAYSTLGIGAPAARIIRVLGEPTRRTATTLVYECGEGAEEPVIFHLSGGVVERVEIDYYVD